MLKNLLQKLNIGLVFLFISCWTLFLFVDYFVHEKFISKAFNNVTLSSILPVMLFLFLGFVFILKRKGEVISVKKVSIDGLSGWKMIGFFFVLTLAYVTTYAGFIDAFEAENTASTASYVILVFSQLFFLILIILPCFVSGSFLLDLFPVFINNKKSKLIIALALGFVCNGLLLFAIAALHFMTVATVLGLFLSICVLGYKRFIALSKEIFIETSSVSSLNILGLLSLFTLLVFIIINFNSSLRPIPIGFDELSLYMNIPKLIAGYNGLTQGGQAYNWSIWMSLGFILNNKVALPTLISILPGILSCYALYRISRNFLDTNFSILCAVIFYIIPTTIWQSSADAKIDLALVFFTLTAVLLLLENNKKSESVYVPSKILSNQVFRFFQNKIWLNTSILLGVLLGYSFGIKYTAIFFVIAISAGFIYKYSQSLSIAAGVVFSGIGFMFIGRLYSFSGIEFDNDSQVNLIGFVFTLLALVSLSIHIFIYRMQHLKGFLYLFVLLAVLSFTFSPWLLKNYRETKAVTVSNLLNGKSALESIDKILNYSIPTSHFHTSKHKEILYAQVEGGTPDYRNDSITNYVKNYGKNTGKYEEVQRYIGYEKGVPKYISIFHDLGILQNVANFPTDIGIFLLVLFPLLFLSLRKRNLYSNLYNMILLGLVLLISLSTLYISEDKLIAKSFMANIDKIKLLNPNYSQLLMSIYVLMASFLNSLILIFTSFFLNLYKTNIVSSYLVLIAVLLITFFVNYHTIKNWGKATKLLFIIAGSSFVTWWFFGSGITWYALPVFALSIPVLFSSLTHEESGILKDKYIRVPVYLLIYSGLLIMLLFRQESMMVTYSYDPKTPSNTKINKLFLQYSHGVHTEDECIDIINKTIANTAQALNNGNNEKILRVGTSLNYFIANNDVRVYEDNQLDLFNGVYTNWYGTKDIISDNFVDNKIRYILFDFATGNLDNTPDKSLTKKVGNFYDYISNNPRIEVVNTDRLLEDPSSKDLITENGKQVPVKYGIFNGTRVIQTGSLVLLKIN